MPLCRHFVALVPHLLFQNPAVELEDSYFCFSTGGGGCRIPI
jgi:hypothetical protein